MDRHFLATRPPKTSPSRPHARAHYPDVAAAGRSYLAYSLGAVLGLPALSCERLRGSIPTLRQAVLGVVMQGGKYPLPHPLPKFGEGPKASTALTAASQTPTPRPAQRLPDQINPSPASFSANGAAITYRREIETASMPRRFFQLVRYALLKRVDAIGERSRSGTWPLAGTASLLGILQKIVPSTYANRQGR